MTEPSHAALPPVAALFSPDPDAIFRALSAPVTDRLIKRIAALDYGNDLAENIAALTRMRDGAFPDGEIAWCPREVLSLGLASVHANYTDEPGRLSGDDAVIAEAFVAAAILRALGTPENDRLADDMLRAVSRLLMALDATSLGFQSESGQLLAWLLTRLPVREINRTLVAAAVLWLATKRRADSDGSTLGALATWIVTEENRIAPALLSDDGFLVREYMSRHWETVGADLALVDVSAFRRQDGEALRDIAVALI